jgi:hypothetical protein
MVWASRGRRPDASRFGLGLLGLLGAAVLAVGGCASGRHAAPHFVAAVPAAPRTLIVVLDAVPFASAHDAVEEEQLLEELMEPVPLISSFPSATTLALSGVFEPLGLATPPGYEAKFFDLERGRVRGGGLLTYGQISFSWREIFHWKTRSLLRKAVGYLQPLRLARWEIEQGIAAFLASDEPIFLVYVGATDGVAHLRGPGGFAPVFRDLDRVLAAARAREEFRTVVLSDHGVGGGEPLRNVRRPLARALADAGFSSRQRIRTRDDVALVPFGLLSSLVGFAAPGRGAELAATIAQVEGISVCAHLEPPDSLEATPGGVAGRPEEAAAPVAASADEATERWWVVGATGRARIERYIVEKEQGVERQGVEKQGVEKQQGAERRPDVEGQASAGEALWRYLPESGDPIGYGDLAEVWRTGSAWADLTVDRRLPDALHRVARTFDLVENAATTVCSTAPGYQYGAALTEWASRFSVGRLRWTHGALERDDTLGFFATDHPGWEPRATVRFDHALDFLAGQSMTASQNGPPNPHPNGR